MGEDGTLVQVREPTDVQRVKIQRVKPALLPYVIRGSKYELHS